MRVGRRVHRIEIRGRGDVAGAQGRADLGHLGLGHGQAGDGHARGRQAHLVVAAVEALGVRADQRREHHVRLDAADVLDNLVDVGLVAAQPQIGFVEDLAAVLLDGVAHDAVGLARIDVVGAHQEDARAAMPDQVGRQLHAALVGRGARVDDVGRILETFVDRGVPQQRVAALDHRQHGLAAMRGAAAEDHVDLVVQQQPAGQPAVFLALATRVVDHRLQRPAQHAAQRIDLFHGQHRAEEMLRLGGAADAAARVQHADAPAGHGRGRRRCGIRYRRVAVIGLRHGVGIRVHACGFIPSGDQ